MNESDDRIFLQVFEEDVIAFSRRLTALDRDRLIRLASGPERSEVENVWHQGIEDYFEGKTSTVLVCRGGEWVRLRGVD